MNVALGAINTIQHAVNGLVNDMERGGVVDYNAQRIAQLAREVSDRMTQVEGSSSPTEPSIGALYAHFFLSLLALAECLARLGVHACILAVCFLLYYLVICISCGKSGGVSEFMSHHAMMVALYWSLFFAILCNIVAPWAPVAYAFGSLTTKFKRPEGYARGETRFRGGCCAACCSCMPGNLHLPIHILLQASLVSYGFVKALSGSLCCGDFTVYLEHLYRQEEDEYEARTVDFYLTQYNCENFQALVQREVGAPQPVPVVMVQPGLIPVVQGRSVPNRH